MDSSKNKDKDDDNKIVGVFDDIKSQNTDTSINDDTTSILENDTQSDFEIKDNTLKPFEENVSLKYPSSWVKATVGGNTVYYVDDTNSTNVNLVKEYMQGYTEDEYIKASISSVKEYFNTNVVLMNEETFNGHKGYTLEYETEAGGQKIRLVQPTVFYEGYAYVFTLGGFPDGVEEQFDEFKEIINTIEFN